MISFDEFLKQDEADKYNMLQECNAIIQQKENITKEVREYIKQNEFYLDYKTGACIKGVMPLLEILDKEELNYEVHEIEEEKKIPEKLKILNANEHSKEVYYENYSKEEISLDIETLQNWVNEIIDYLYYLKSKGE